ncbi:ATP-grasp domain-containing protein [Streptacidiphilus cavernicola]|uniref:ATP-grasp domain-containing protein n=1 Tax=Streptacidiphilus cavernicola TaxID=3342716 RepID=A0ABV6W0R0_9ACTN
MTASAAASAAASPTVSASLLLCCDPLRPARCDPHFADHATAARDLGAAVALLDHDALLAGDAAEAVRRVPKDLGPLWYRGWMIPVAAYAELETALAARGGQLRTSAEQYRTAHQLPGWYHRFAEATPASGWLACAPGQAPTREELAALARSLPPGAGIVKDYVKSRKHEWDTACYLPDLADTEAVHRVVSRFVEVREDSLAGGVVLRAFERFSAATGEARIWWLDGGPVLTTPHPDSPELLPCPDLAAVRPLVAALGCRFVSTDLALREDGAWRVVEVGDGQVSGLPAGTDPSALLKTLFAGTDEQLGAG